MEMASIATDLAKSILEKLIDATIVQSGYICCFTCIAKEFEKEKKTLKAKRTTVGEYVKVANRRAEGIRSDVIFWQEQVDKLIQEDTKTRMTCFSGWCPNCKWQYSRGKDLANKTKKIKRLMESNFESVGIPRAVAGVEYHSSQDYISFKSRELKCKELLDALTNDNNYMTGLQGMGGTGKTTLAKEVGKELKKSEKFDHVIDATVSYAPDIKKIQDEIAGPLGLSLEYCTEPERPKTLWSRLINGEKILLILDDVWENINFEDIGIPYNDNHNGCRILITTCNLRTCNSMRCDRIIQLELLPEEDAWILFKKRAGISDSSSKSILDKGRKIAKECKGLPIAIAVIASSIKGEQRPEEWNVALKSLQDCSLRGDDENLGKIYKCLRYSYDNMNNEKATGLFLLCSMFREDQEFSVEILTRFSVGVGLVGEIDDNYDAGRNEVVVAKNKLIDSCLLLNGESGRVKMHDLVREVALLIANEEIKAVNTSNKNEKSLVEKAKNLKYLLCEGKSMDVFSLKFDGSKLGILIVYLDGDENDSVEVPNSFFENIIGLRVLYLSHKTWIWWKATLSLPQSIQSLTNIRSLYLERFDLGDISILGNLRGLETLDLVDCLMDELPPEFAELKKLKLLNLDWCYIRWSNPFKVIESCSSLEELHFVRSFPIDRLTMHQKVKLPKLHRFRIVDECPFYFRADWSGRNSLSISKVDVFFSEVTFKHLVQTTEFLNLFGLQGGWRNLIPEIILPEYEGTLNLVVLCLKSISQLECLVDTKHIDSRVQNVFSKLIELRLEEMENLKELYSGPLPFELMKSLETLYVRNCIHLGGILFKSKLTLCNLKSMSLNNCPMLTSLFQLSTTQSLVLLERLFIENCEQMKSIITDERTREDLEEEIVDDDNDNKSAGSMFPNLKTLQIKRCPQLDFILPMVAARDVPKLEDIEIRDCVELKYIFDTYQNKHEEQDLQQELKDVIFVTLKKMVLNGLPNFVDIFPECDQSMHSSVKKLCSKDDSETQIESDPIKCNILPWINCKTTKIPLHSKDQLQGCFLSSIHDSKVNDVIRQEMAVTFQLSDMHQMTCLFVVPNIYYTLKNVTVLRITNCERMEVIFSASMLRCLPQLHILDISGCNGLKQIIEEDTRNQRMSYFLSPQTLFPMLKVLVIEECNNLKCVFPISTSKIFSKLEFLVIKKACMLEEVFKCESDQKVEISNLKIAVFVELPSLFQEIEFQTVKDRLVQNCPKLSLTSTLTPDRIRQIIYSGMEGSDVTNEYIEEILQETLDDLCEDSEAHETCNQNPTAKATDDFPIGTEVEAASGTELTSSHVYTNQSVHANIDDYIQNENGIESTEFISVETQTKETLEAEQEFVEKVPSLEISSIAMSPTDSKLIPRPCRCHSDIPLHETYSHCLKEIEGPNTQEGSMLEKSLIATLSTYPKRRETSWEPLFNPPQKGIRRSFEERTTSAFDNTITLSTCSESNIDFEIVSQATTKKEPTLKAKVQKPSFSPADEESSSSSYEDEQEVQGNKGSNYSTPSLSEALEKTPPQEASKEQSSNESIDNNKRVPKYTAMDIDNCLKKLDDDPFALLDFMSREVSMSPKQHKTNVQQSSTIETLASALLELRTLAFSQSMMKNIGKVEYREKVEAAIRKLDKFPKDTDQDLDKRIRSFIELFKKAEEVCQEQSSTVDLIKQADAEKKEALEKLQTTKDKVLQLDEAIEKRKPKLEDIEKRQKEVKDAMKKLQEELNELDKDKAKLESENTECSSKKAELIESVKYVSNALGKTSKHLVDLEKTKAKHDANFEALKDPYKKMKANPPF